MPSNRKSKPMPSGLRSAQKRITAQRERYVEGVRNGSIPMPAQYDAKGNMTPEAKSLARRASLAAWGKGPKVMRPHSSGSGITQRPNEC
jgi:hypothetical protein